MIQWKMSFQTISQLLSTSPLLEETTWLLVPRVPPRDTAWTYRDVLCIFCCDCPLLKCPTSLLLYAAEVVYACSSGLPCSL